MFPLAVDFWWRIFFFVSLNSSLEGNMLQISPPAIWLSSSSVGCLFSSNFFYHIHVLKISLPFSPIRNRITENFSSITAWCFHFYATTRLLASKSISIGFGRCSLSLHLVLLLVAASDQPMIWPNNNCQSITVLFPLDETHLDMVRGLM